MFKTECYRLLLKLKLRNPDEILELSAEPTVSETTSNEKVSADMSSSDGKRSPKSPNKSPREKSPKSPKSKSPTGAKKPSVPVQAPLTASKKSKTPNVIDDGKKKYFLLLFLGWFDWFDLFNVFLFIQKIEYL